MGTSTELRKAIEEIAKKHPPMNAEEERNLCLENSPDVWRRLLVLHNVRFAASSARRFDVKGEDGDDLFMRSLEGMIRAAERFEPEKGFRFTTFASFYIRSAFGDVIFSDKRQDPRAIMFKNTDLNLDTPIRGEKDNNDYTCVVDSIPGMDAFARRSDIEDFKTEFNRAINGLVEELSERAAGRTVAIRDARWFKLRVSGMSIGDIALKFGVDNEKVKTSLRRSKAAFASMVKWNRPSVAGLISIMPQLQRHATMTCGKPKVERL